MCCRIVGVLVDKATPTETPSRVSVAPFYCRQEHSESGTRPVDINRAGGACKECTSTLSKMRGRGCGYKLKHRRATLKEWAGLLRRVRPKTKTNDSGDEKRHERAIEDPTTKWPPEGGPRGTADS